MPMAKRLDLIVDSQLVLTLAGHKIFLVHEFCAADTDKLSKITGLRPKAILGLKNELSRNLPQPIDAYEAYTKQTADCSTIMTSIPGLDEILGGGLQIGSMLELCGSSGCGKTQICINIAINLAAQHKIRVVYVDTKHDLMSSHFAAIVDALGFETEKAEILDRVLVTRPDTLYSLISTLANLQRILKRDKGIKILIIDSIVTLNNQFLSSQDNEGLSLLSHIASLLHYLSTNYKLAILLVNLGTKRNVLKDEHEIVNQDGGSRDTEESLIPALGKIWVGVPQTRLILTKKNDMKSVRSLTVHRSLIFPKKRKSKVYILSDGTVK